MPKKRDIQLQEVLQYELASDPLALSDPDASSSLCKKAKSELFKYLKKSIPAVAVIPFNSPKTYHSMVLFQKLPSDLETFGDISDYILNKIMQGGCRTCFVGHSDVLEGREVYITIEDQAFSISCSNNSISKVPVRALSSQQEEADTKIFLCAQFAFQLGFERVNVVTIDTDVVLPAVYFQSQLTGKI